MKSNKVWFMLVSIALGCGRPSGPLPGLEVSADVLTVHDLQEQWPKYKQELVEAGLSPEELEGRRKAVFDLCGAREEVLKTPKEDVKKPAPKGLLALIEETAEERRARIVLEDAEALKPITCIPRHSTYTGRLVDFAMPVHSRHWDGSDEGCSQLDAMFAAMPAAEGYKELNTDSAAKAVRAAMKAGFEFQWAVLEVLPHAVRVSGVDVMPLIEGRPDPGDLRGTLMSPVFDALRSLAWRQKHGSCGRRFDGRLLIIVDQSVPLATTRAVMFTAGQAQFAEFSFVSPYLPPESGWDTGSLRRLDVTSPLEMEPSSLPRIGVPGGELTDPPFCEWEFKLQKHIFELKKLQRLTVADEDERKKLQRFADLGIEGIEAKGELFSALELHRALDSRIAGLMLGFHQQQRPDDADVRKKVEDLQEKEGLLWFVLSLLGVCL